MSIVKKCYFCLSSKNSAISDGFKSILLDLSLEITKGEYMVVGTPYSVPADFHDLPNVMIIDYKKNPLGACKIIASIPIICSLLKSNNIPELFIYSFSYVHMLFVLLMPRKARLNSWIHDPLLHSGEKKWISILKIFNDFFIYKLKKRARFFVSSKFLRNTLVSIGISESRVVPLQFPYLPELATEAAIDSSINQKNRDGVIFFGRLESYKGLDWFVESLLNYDKDITPFKFTVVGKGKLPDKLDELKNKGIEVFVINEFVPNEMLAGMIGKSKIAVFPYRDATSSQAPQTAGVLGCINLVSNVGSLSECVVKNSSYIIHRDDSKGFIGALNNALLCKINVFDISRSYLDEFSMKHFVQKLEEHLDSK